jgi:CIC family chloride channel protein
MAGGFFGSIVHSLLPGITASPGAYSIVGMAAVVSGTTHGPLSAMLILFEMTGDYKIILPLMITCIISTLASGRLLEDSIYTLKLARRGVNLKSGKEVNVLKSIPVKSVMNVNIETISESMPLGEMAKRIFKSKNTSFPVVDSNGALTGILSYYDYQEAIFDEDLKGLIVAKDLASSKIVTVSQDDNLFDAFEKISRKDYSTLPVVSSHDPTILLGILSRRDILSAYSKAVIKKSVFEENKR